jgi:hypothetical protein
VYKNNTPMERAPQSLAPSFKERRDLFPLVRVHAVARQSRFLQPHLDHATGQEKLQRLAHFINGLVNPAAFQPPPRDPFKGIFGFGVVD